MAFFNIIIPTFNSQDTVRRAVETVERQTFKDYRLILVDDCSTDNTPNINKELAEKYPNITALFPSKKLFNGGVRNYGVQHAQDCEYLLFLDSDDELLDDRLFQDLHNIILIYRFPDMVRLPYEKIYDESGRKKLMMLNDEQGVAPTSLANVACSKRVACWTKAVKRELFQPFPENTLFEDVVQHLLQCDVITNVTWFSRPFVRWHIHSASTSHNNSPKWRSSAWRFVADLMDLELKHDYCDKRRKQKMQSTKEGLLKGIAIQ